MSAREELILQEVAVRAQQRLAVADLVRAIRSELFDKQLAVIDDPSKQVAPLCSRRAGKTNTWPRCAVICALERPRSLIRIWAVSRIRCQQLVWDEIIRLCARHKIEIKANETVLSLKFPNGSEIRLLGADKLKEAEKKRGDKTAMEIIIESQLFGNYLEQIVNDIAGPGLADLNGTFYLEGTPGPVCAGHWYSISGGNDTASRWMSEGRNVQGVHTGAGWSCHRWTLLDNPFPTSKLYWRAWLTAKKQQMRWGDDNPTYRREYLGQWVNDFSSLYFKFDPLRNTFDGDSMQPWGPGWMHTLGWDIAFRDSMALAVWAFSPKYPDLYEAFSWKQAGVTSDVVMAQIDELVRRGFNFTKMVADTGGGGKLYVEEIQKRYPFAFEPASKSQKYQHVQLLNDDLLTGFVKVRQGSVLAGEFATIVKDPDWDPDSGKPPTEDPRIPNDVADAALYAYRGAMHYLHRPDPRPIARGSAEHFKREEAKMVAKLENRRAKVSANWLENYDAEQPPTVSWDDDDTY